MKTNEINERKSANPDYREAQLISLAVDLVEQRLRNGTATSQETTHFLKLADKKHQLELDVLKKQLELADAKIKNLDASSNFEKVCKDAMEAFSLYSGQKTKDE